MGPDPKPEPDQTVGAIWSKPPRQVARAFGIGIGTVVILALGLYGPATLLGPLPAVSVELKAPAQEALHPLPPTLPQDGASAIVLEVGAAPIAVAGDAETLPMAGITKIVTALVVLEAKPVAPGRTGPAIEIGLEDYRSYIDNTNADNVTVTVLPGETWTEREMLQAMLLGSSNNHADSLARWAYGSKAAFLDAANAWLVENGLTATRVVDATGLSEQSAGSAGDLALLAALAMANPTIAELLNAPSSDLANDRGVKNRTAYLPELGITGISRSYTDAAGICLLFAASVTVGEQTVPFYGAFLGVPDWHSLDAAGGSMMESASAGIQLRALVSEGEVLATFTSPWGDTANGIAATTKTEVRWQLEPPATPLRVTTTQFNTNPRGARVGSIQLTAADSSAGNLTDGGELTLPLVLDRGIGDPGPGWRLLNPVPVVSALIQSWQSQSED
jgi:serine-type D-Ala-D-Ala carboxypeptidase (penicillin-binding protein 5/6)